MTAKNCLPLEWFRHKILGANKNKLCCWASIILNLISNLWLSMRLILLFVNHAFVLLKRFYYRHDNAPTLRFFFINFTFNSNMLNKILSSLPYETTLEIKMQIPQFIHCCLNSSYRYHFEIWMQTLDVHDSATTHKNNKQ